MGFEDKKSLKLHRVNVEKKRARRTEKKSIGLFRIGSGTQTGRQACRREKQEGKLYQN